MIMGRSRVAQGSARVLPAPWLRLTDPQAVLRSLQDLDLGSVMAGEGDGLGFGLVVPFLNGAVTATSQEGQEAGVRTPDARGAWLSAGCGWAAAAGLGAGPVGRLRGAQLPGVRWWFLPRQRLGVTAARAAWRAPRLSRAAERSRA